MLKIKNSEPEKHLRVSPKYHQAVKLYAEKRNATIKSREIRDTGSAGLSPRITIQERPM